VLPSEHRLTDADTFRRASRTGRRSSSRTLVVHLAPVDAGPARAGFVVSKAVGNAVVRNRVKRRLRHLVRDRLGLLPAASALVVRALPAAAAASSSELAADLDRCLVRVQPRGAA
jgi:ribonuclease P protein component